MSMLPSNGTRATTGVREAAGASAAAKVRPAGKRSRQRHTPGGAALGKDAGQEAQRTAAAVLDVLAGVRTPRQAAEALGVSQARYFQVETRAVQALVDSCAPRPRGPGRNVDKELATLRRQLQRLQQEVSRQQTLLRLAQRTIGLPPPRPTLAKPSGTGQSKKRPRRPVVRALRAAEALQRRSQEAAQSASPEAAAPAVPEQG
jgi:hypothetical protein